MDKRTKEEREEILRRCVKLFAEDKEITVKILTHRFHIGHDALIKALKDAGVFEKRTPWGLF